ncbi:MAG TPA: sensor domain-containing protein [Candidatus Limnocylindrales bacterium]
MRSRAREFGWLIAGALIGLPALGLWALVVASAGLSLAAGLGLATFAGVVWMSRRLAGIQRRRAAAVLDRPIPPPYRPLPAGSASRGMASRGMASRGMALRGMALRGMASRLRTVAADPATWRDLAWQPCQFVAGVGGLLLAAGLWLGAAECVAAPLLVAVFPEPTGFDPALLDLIGRSEPLAWAAVPAGVALAVAAVRLPRVLLRGQARLAEALLGPTKAAADAARLSARVDSLVATRAAAVDASAAEVRRIERDLHDGAQARLIAVAMSLGVAQDVIDADPATAKTLLAEAKANAGAALTELRDLVRGIHPPVLADRGLAGAVEALCLRSAIRVDLDLRLRRRLTAPVESAAYFAVCESLANAIRHSHAARVRITLVDDGAALRLTVHDDGRGGADPGRGTGLLGIGRRLAALDGTLHLSSPAGGPTVLAMELPCAS